MSLILLVGFLFYAYVWCLLAKGSEYKIAFKHQFMRDVESFMREDLVII